MDTLAGWSDQFLPELTLFGTALLLLLSELTYRRERFRLITGAAFFGFLIAILFQLASFSGSSDSGGAMTLQGFFVWDSFGSLFRLLFQLLGLGVVILAAGSREVSRERHAEFLIFLCAAVIGAGLIVSANHFVAVFVAAQILMVSLQFLATFQKRSVLSVEAGLKTWSAQWLGSVFFLVAVVMFTTALHHLDLSGLRELVRAGQVGDMAWLGFGFLVLAVFAWMGLFPFHSWIPDAATGMPLAALAPALWLGPAAGGAFLLRFFAQTGQWVQGVEVSLPILSVFPMVSAVFAVVYALRQDSLKRMIALLSAARWGVWVAVMPDLNSEMFAGFLLIAVTELPAMAGALYSLVQLSDRHGASTLSRMSGAARRFAPESFSFLFFLFVLVGLPPFPGFLGLYVLISGLFHHGADALAWLTLSTLVVSWVAFFRVSIVLCREAAAEGIPQGRITGPLGLGYLAALAIPILLIGIYAENFLKWFGRVVFPTVW